MSSTPEPLDCFSSGQFRDGRTSPLAEALDTYLTGGGLFARAREYMAAVVWPDVVGEWYARHTHVTRVHQGALTVQCDSAPRAQQLQLDAPEIIGRLNAALGGPFIEEIRASSGGIRRKRGIVLEPRSPSTPSELELEQWPLAVEDLQRIANLAASVEDAALRARFEAVLIRAARLEAWRRAHGWRVCAGCGLMLEPEQKRCLGCDPGPKPAQGSHEDVYDGAYQKRRPRRWRRG